jgi:hypothetical protein
MVVASLRYRFAMFAISLGFQAFERPAVCDGDAISASHADFGLAMLIL